MKIWETSQNYAKLTMKFICNKKKVTLLGKADNSIPIFLNELQSMIEFDKLQ